MDQDQIQRIERLERQNKRLERQNEELKEQVKHLIEVVTSVTRGRSQEEGQTSNQGTPIYPSGFELVEVAQTTAPENTTAARPQRTMLFPFPPPPPFGAYSYVPTSLPP